MFRNLLFFSFLLIYTSDFLQAQGCSDAGICNLSNSSPNRSSSFFNLGIELGTESGGDLVQYNYFNLLPTYKINDFTFFARLPFVYLSGLTGDPNGNNTALYSISDISLGANYSLLNDNKQSLLFSFAAKIPTNKADVIEKGIVLPMYMQTNQGSFDLLASFDYLYNDTKIFLGVQLPLTANKNITLIGDTRLNELKRSPDIAFGMKQLINISEKSTFKLGLLSLYRVSENVWSLNGATLDSISQNNYKFIDGDAVAINSNGLTLNLLLGFEQKLNENSSIALNLGVPMLNRKYIDDGLKRVYTLSLTTMIGF